MGDRTSRTLLEGNVIRLIDVSCRATESAPEAEEEVLTTQLVLPLRGCFEVHRGDDRTVADATSVVILRAGDIYRVGHPASGGDDSFVFALSQEAAEDVVASAGVGGPVEPTVRLRAHRARVAVRRRVVDPLEAEEGALDLLRAMLRGSIPETSAGRRPTLMQRINVERVRALLASRPAERWTLDRIATEAFVSPSHLARQFRTVTGGSISRHLLRLRLGLALDRLAAGEPDLARLALELGFAHHSHFSARFRATFGITPSAFRRSLSAERLAELRTIVTVPRRAPS